MKGGKLIVIDGIDGAGKGVQSHLASNYLEHFCRVNVLSTFEPTAKTPQIRGKLKENFDPVEGKEWLAQKFVEDRIKHCVEEIRPALEKGIYVVCDRYKYSTIAYQHAQGMGIEELVSMHTSNPEIIVPDLTIILTLPAETGFRRRNSAGAIDVFDKNLDFQKKVLEVYKKMPSIFPEEQIRIVDANGSVDSVHATIAKYIEETVYSDS